jgi:UDPglucose 6-dehydrogenase
VGTPKKNHGSANLNYVFGVAEQIAKSVEKNCVVVVKSTVPIGTNDKVEEYIRENLCKDVHVDVASNPEFLSQGTAVYDTLNCARIVIGVESETARKVMEKVYESFNSPLLITNRKSAEMIKYASNNFLALKVSYINEIANLCEIVGANIDDVACGMGFDKRIGDRFLRAGIGYGGSCFPKDTKALNWLATANDYELKTVKAAIEVNERQKLRLIKKARKYYESFENLTVAVLGLTFKPGTDDLREAPSLVNIPILLEEGARIQAWDPIGMKNFQKFFPAEISYCANLEDALDGADICLIFTEWNEIVELSPEVIKKKMKKPIVLDGRNCLNKDIINDKEIIYDGIGRM